MKITMVINSDVGLHGVGLRPYPIIKEASKRGHKVIVFCRDHKKDDIQNCRFLKPLFFGKFMSLFFEGIKYYITSQSDTITKISKKSREVFDKIVAFRLKKGDIFHAWDFPLEAFRKAKEKGMITIKDYCMANLEGASKIGKLEDIKGQYKMPERERKCYDYIDYFFVASPFNYESMIAYGVPREKLFLVPYGVDINQFYPVKRKEDGKFKILFLGTINRRKDVPSLLEAVHLTGKKNIELVLVGSVDPSIKDVLNDYKKLINLEVKGFVKHDKINELYNNADIFIFPSLRESSAKIIYEALASGLPVITTYNTGSVIEDDKQGFIVPTKSPESIKDRILFLYNNPEERKKMSKAARRLAENYTWEDYGERVCDIYEKIIKNKK